MHDIRFIREHPEVFDHALARRGLPASAAGIMTLDGEKRACQTAMQELQAKRNDISKQIGTIKSQKGDATALMQEVTSIKESISKIEDQEKEFDAKLKEILSSLPNQPALDVPEGKDETGNKELRRSGEPKRINSAKQHFEIGEALGYMDFETAAKLSGARFTILKGPLAHMERALANFMLDIHTKEFDYQEISPPLMVRDEIMYGTGQLPKFQDDQFLTSRKLTYEESLQIYLKVRNEGDNIDKNNNPYFDLLPFGNDGSLINQLNQAGNERYEQLRQEKGGLWLIPTAEVPLTNFVNDMIVAKEELPMRLTAKTPCFRAEAGAAGKDTRGMLRQHQFYKVEMVSITTPDQSEAEHERMTQCAETVLKRLELPFRTMALCTGDMGFASRKTYDIEVWMPGQNAYREISSCSNCGDFQARRMNARFRAGEKHTEFLHTLNGSGVAIGRCLIAIVENFQESDGSISIPSALRPYMNGLERIQMAAK